MTITRDELQELLLDQREDVRADSLLTIEGISESTLLSDAEKLHLIQAELINLKLMDREMSQTLGVDDITDVLQYNCICGLCFESDDELDDTQSVVQPETDTEPTEPESAKSNEPDNPFGDKDDNEPKSQAPLTNPILVMLDALRTPVDEDMKEQITKDLSSIMTMMQVIFEKPSK